MLVERFADNPLITPADVKPSRDDYEVIGAFNPAAVRFGDEVLLMLRVAERPRDIPPGKQVAPIYDATSRQIRHFIVDEHDSDVVIPDSRSFYYKGNTFLTSISHLRIARSHDGIHFRIDERPAVFPELDYEAYGLEDARITPFDDHFLITCKVVSEQGIATSLIRTRDFATFDRLGMIFSPENLDVVIFPELIRGRYFALTRPVPRYLGRPSMWTAESPDALHWGVHRMCIPPREGMFDSAKTGASCIPIKTPHGWLEIYHGADASDRYYLGAALLDLSEPWRVIARSMEPLMTPEASYEVTGFYGNVVFPCGAIVESNGKIHMYYGAADAVTAAATTSIDRIMNTLR